MYGMDTLKTERIDESNVDAAFHYQPWNLEQVEAGEGGVGKRQVERPIVSGDVVSRLSETR